MLRHPERVPELAPALDPRLALRVIEDVAVARACDSICSPKADAARLAVGASILCAYPGRLRTMGSVQAQGSRVMQVVLGKLPAAGIRRGCGMPCPVLCQCSIQRAPGEQDPRHRSGCRAGWSAAVLGVCGHMRKVTLAFCNKPTRLVGMAVLASSLYVCCSLPARVPITQFCVAPTCKLPLASWGVRSW